MTDVDGDLAEYLAVLHQVGLDAAASGKSSSAEGTSARYIRGLNAAGAFGLASEIVGEAHPLRWLSAVVEQISSIDPSVGFATAAHYAAQVSAISVGSPLPEGRIGTAGIVNSPGSGVVVAVVPALLEPTTVLLLDGTSGAASLERASSFLWTDARHRYSGLRNTRLTCLEPTHPPVDATGSTSDSTEGLAVWNILCSAVSTGIAMSALSAAESYASEREQFGSALISFGAIRAMLAEMRVKVDQARLQLAHASLSTADQASSFALTAHVGRSSVDIVLDAIQVHGGYGYIEEYPVAALLRDALSVNARASARRDAIAQLASDRLTTPGRTLP